MIDGVTLTDVFVYHVHTYIKSPSPVELVCRSWGFLDITISLGKLKEVGSAMQKSTSFETQQQYY